VPPHWSRTCGEVYLARERAEEAVALGHRYGVRLAECVGNLVLARVLPATEGVQAALAIEDALARALALIEVTGAISEAPFIRVDWAEPARLSGDESTRQRELREAHRLFTAMGATGHAERIGSLIHSD